MSAMSAEGPQPFDPDAFYTLREIRQLLRISDATARRWIKAGRLKARKIGRDYRVKGDEVLANAPTGGQRIPSGEFGPDHPLLKLIGIADSGLTDVSERHHDYLAEIYYGESNSPPK